MNFLEGVVGAQALRRAFRGLIIVAILSEAACGKAIAPELTPRGMDAILHTRQISHAMGEIDGHTYLNCLECFELSYGQGHRFMETDLMVASDGKIVAMHDGLETRFGLPEGFTSSQFMSVKLLDEYSPLDGPGLVRLFQEKTDWYMVTDVKTDNVAGLKELCKELLSGGVDCTQRVIPQIYAPSELPGVEALGFNRIILTLYRLSATPATITEAVDLMRAHSDVFILTLPHVWWDGWVRDLFPDGSPVPIFVHTVNGAEDEARYFSEGVAGIYTDSLTPAQGESVRSDLGAPSAQRFGREPPRGRTSAGRAVLW